MKRNRLHKILLWSSIGLTAVSCNKMKDFGDTNANPVDISVAQPEALLTSTLAGLGGFTGTSGIYTQYFMESQYPSACFYADNSSSFTGTYSGSLSYLQKIIDLRSTNNMVQISKILQQYFYFNLTNAWGEVPYSQALKGQYNTKPKYDSQDSIYYNIIATLRSSVDSMDASAITGDIIYSGSAAKWKKFGNSMVMLAAVQLSKRYPGASDYAAKAFNAALSNAGGYLSANTDNCIIAYPSTTYPNPFYSLYYSRQDYGESATLTNLMSSLSDTRQNAFGGASNVAGSTTSSSIGLPFGVTRTEVVNFLSANPTWARILRGDLRTATSSYPILTSSYITLIRAEAANLGWTTESASDLYKAGITLSFAYWGATVPADYFTQSAVALGTDNVKKIATQQYIAVYPNGTYAWNIWRKTGYPTLIPSANAANASGQIPRRYKYATSEATTNGDSYNAAIAKFNGAYSDVARMWWDVE